MSQQKRKFQPSLPLQQEDTEEVADKILIEQNFNNFLELEQQDKNTESELHVNDGIVQNDCGSRLQEILSYLNDDDEEDCINQLPKRPRLSVNPSEDSPCSSMDSYLSDIRDLINESPPSASNLITDIIPSMSSTPEVIDLSSPIHQKESSDVVDLTDEPNSPTLVNEVVDLTTETVDSLDSSPIIVSVGKIFERRSVIVQRPSCRFETLAATDIINSDEVHEVSENISGNNENSNKSKQDDESTKNITCPICFDDASLLKRRKRQLSSTICGHVFCDTCIKSAIKTQHKCPTCRKKLTLKQIHPLFL